MTLAQKAWDQFFLNAPFVLDACSRHSGLKNVLFTLITTGVMSTLISLKIKPHGTQIGHPKSEVTFENVDLCCLHPYAILCRMRI